MTAGRLDRRSALLLAGGVGAVLLLRFVVLSGSAPAVVPIADSVPLAEQRLANLRAEVATVPGKQKTAQQAAADLGVLEKGMIRSQTAAQAQAQLLEIIRHTGKSEGIDVRGAEEMRVRPLDGDYGEVIVAVDFACRIDQFVNMMADLANRPELLATNAVRVGLANPKEKTLNVRLELSGVVPRNLVPVKKGPAAL